MRFSLWGLIDPGGFEAQKKKFDRVKKCAIVKNGIFYCTRGQSNRETRF